MERKKYFINDESDARKCGMFDAFYASGESEYAGVNVLADGTLRIDFLAKNLSNCELIRFHNEPLKIYALHLESDCYAILLRGMVDMDVIIDPNIYSDNRGDATPLQPIKIVRCHKAPHYFYWSIFYGLRSIGNIVEIHIISIDTKSVSLDYSRIITLIELSTGNTCCLNILCIVQQNTCYWIVHSEDIC